MRASPPVSLPQERGGQAGVVSPALLLLEGGVPEGGGGR